MNSLEDTVTDRFVLRDKNNLEGQYTFFKENWCEYIHNTTKGFDHKHKDYFVGLALDTYCAIHKVNRQLVKSRDIQVKPNSTFEEIGFFRLQKSIILPKLEENNYPIGLNMDKMNTMSELIEENYRLQEKYKISNPFNE